MNSTVQRRRARELAVDATALRSANDFKALLEYWRQMDRRNRVLGLKRYDYGDVHSHPLMQTIARMPMAPLIVRFAQIPEWCAPILWRKALGIRRQLVPSVFYHLGMSYLAMTKLKAGTRKDSTIAVADEAIATRATAEHLCWEHPYRHHAQTLKKSSRSVDWPQSCAHHTSRIGQMLLAIGTELDRPDLQHAGISTARALLQYHFWQWYGDGTCTISYYPDTRDEVINTAADVVTLFLSIPKTYRTDELQSALDGLINMIVAEQQPDGSWYYCTSRYYDQTGAKRFIDGHHTAMVLKALATASTVGGFNQRLHKSIEQSLESGVGFYVHHLLRPEGKALYFPDSTREAGVVGYTEGISALCACLQSPALAGTANFDRLYELVPKLMKNAVDTFLDRTTYDVACCRFLGRPYQIQSARWGSAPLMHAITDFLLAFSLHCV
jgi:hypothetical protein